MLKKWMTTALLFSAAMAFAAVDVNQASEVELDGIKGLGPSTTAKILAERTKSPFKDWTDLMARVKGIKSTSATKLSTNGLTVDGNPFPPNREHTP